MSYIFNMEMLNDFAWLLKAWQSSSLLPTDLENYFSQVLVERMEAFSVKLW